MSKAEECNRQKDYTEIGTSEKKMKMKQYKRTIMMMTMLILLAIAFVPIIWLKVEREKMVIDRRIDGWMEKKRST